MRNLIYLVLMVFIVACGPNQKEVEERAKFVADSIKVVQEDSIAKVKEQAEQERVHKEKIEVGKSVNRTKLTKLLEDLKSRLETHRAKLNEANQFHLMRTPAEKQQQVSQEQEQVMELQMFISNVEKEISMTYLFNSFPFQETPRGTVQYFFDAVKNEDFSKMRHLLDPYGEYDNDALQMCMAEMMPPKMREEWKLMFSNGRIMSDPVIKGDKADVEVAIGPSSDKLEKINMVKRMDRWYISGM